MSSTTFFGEVNELKSRAIYWSDEESDEEPDERQLIEPNVGINLDHNLPEECQTVFISLIKNDKTVEKELAQIGCITIDGTAESIGQIFSVNKTSVWLRINSSHPYLKKHLLVKTISTLLRQLLAKLEAKPTIVLISKDLMKDSGSDDTITYLTSNYGNLTIIPSEVKSRPLLAPKMLTNLIESSIFEYCTVFGIQCIALLLPECQSHQLDLQFIPKPIVDSINQLNRISDSNIYI